MTELEEKYIKLVLFVEEIALWNVIENKYFNEANELLEEIGEMDV